MLDFLKKLLPGPKVKKVDIAKRFELIGRVGQGSMSQVWKARDHQSGKVVALKLLDVAKTKALEARFPKLNKPTEGEISASLKHKHIVKTLEHGVTTKNEQFLVMEFVEGTALTYLIDAQNEKMKKHRLNMMIELGEAISYFHRQNWIHRDICPRNVLLDQENSIKLIDFGLVVPNTPPFKVPGNRTGTINYMAPELIKRQRTDQRIDVFSYAVTCYEMWAKRLPWDSGKSIEQILQYINSPPVDVAVRNPDIDPEVAQVIMKGIETQPDQRWQTVGEMVNRFREIQDRSPTGMKV